MTERAPGAAGALVVGLGNRLRGDDAAGLEAVRLLGRGAPAAVLEHEGEPLGLIELWEGARLVVVVDAVSSGGPAGSLHRVDAADAPLPARLRSPAAHAFGLADTIELARVLGRLPPALLVMGVEGACFDTGAGLSPEVSRALPALVAAVLAELGRPSAAVPG